MNETYRLIRTTNHCEAFHLSSYPFRLCLDLLLFLAVIIMPLGVKGLTLAVGLSNLLWKHDATGLGLSIAKSLVHFEGTGVCMALFSIKVFGVVGESKSLSALTLL